MIGQHDIGGLVQSEPADFVQIIARPGTAVMVADIKQR